MALVEREGSKRVAIVKYSFLGADWSLKRTLVLCEGEDRDKYLNRPMFTDRRFGRLVVRIIDSERND